jgi:hypothetical protein
MGACEVLSTEFRGCWFAKWLVLAKEMVGYLVGNEEKAGAIVKLMS